MDVVLGTYTGDADAPNYRSRIVAREITVPGKDPMFAPTPPLESVRMVLSLAATHVSGYNKHTRDPYSEYRTQISFVDISRGRRTPGVPHMLNFLEKMKAMGTSAVYSSNIYMEPARPPMGGMGNTLGIM